MPPKGVSAEDKRQRMLDLFHSTKDVMNLKELEKLGAKQGVISQAIKEIVLLLVSDGLVQSDKIGSGQYYWAFPSQRSVLVKNAHQAKKSEVERLAAQVDQLEMELAAVQEGREDTAERQQLQHDYELEKQRNEALTQALGKFSDADPIQFEKRNSEILILREACGFWTDATIAAVAYARDRTGTSSDQLNKMFDISDDFEDLEWPKLALETIAAPSAHNQPDVKEPEPAVHAPQSTTPASQASLERVDTPNDQSMDPADVEEEEDGAAAITLDALFD